MDFLDQTYVLTTPDAKDIFSRIGMQQINTVMSLQIDFYQNNPYIFKIHLGKLTYQIDEITREIEGKIIREIVE